MRGRIWSAVALSVLLAVGAVSGVVGLSRKVPTKSGRVYYNPVQRIVNRACRGGCSGLVALLHFSFEATTDLKPSNADICATMSTELQGNYICFRGDGTQSSASGTALTVTGGSATAESPQVSCGNGNASCAVAPSLFFPSGVSLSSPAVSHPQGDFTLCITYFVDWISTDGINELLGYQPGTFSINTTGHNGSTYVQMQGPSNTTVFLGQISSPAGWISECSVFSRVGDGTSILKNYANSFADTTSSVAHIPASSGTAAWSFLQTNGGHLRNILYTEKALTLDKVKAYTAASLGGAFPSDGGYLAQPHVFDMACPQADGGFYTATSANGPCSNELGGIYQQMGRQNYLLWPEEFDKSATWTLNFGGTGTTPVVTANVGGVMSPGGLFDVESVAFPAVSGAGNYSYIEQVFTPQASQISGDVYARLSSGTGTLWLDIHDNADGGYNAASCALTSSWTKCLDLGKAALAHAYGFRIGTDLRTGSPESATPAQTVYLSSANVSNGNTAPFYVRNGSSSFGASTSPVSVPMNLVLADQADFSFSTEMNPQRAYDNLFDGQVGTGLNFAIFGLGSQFGGANTMQYYINSSTSFLYNGTTQNLGTLSARVYDNSGNFRWRFTGVKPSPGKHKFALRKIGGEVFMYMDGLPLPVMQDSLQPINNSGTGVVASFPSTFEFGPPVDAAYTKACLEKGNGCEPSGFKKIAMIGDSIFYSPVTEPDVSPSVQLQSLIADAGTVYNYAIGGTRTDQMEAVQWQTLIKGSGFDTVFVMSGINDVCQGQSAATASANQEALYEEMEAVGIKVIPVTATPWKGSGCWTSANETATEAIRTTLLANCTSHGRTCVDAWSALGNTAGGDPQSWLPAYASPDHVHPSIAGAQALGNLLRTALP